MSFPVIVAPFFNEITGTIAEVSFEDRLLMLLIPESVTEPPSPVQDSSIIISPVVLKVIALPKVKELFCVSSPFPK